MLQVTWFVLAAIPLVAYTVLDGFDLGVGMLHHRVAHTDNERRAVLRSIGPIWDGNEVWLVVAGATLFLAFPVLFGVAFSGFYLPLTLVLWLLVFRALGIELRHLLPHPLFSAFWDASFAGASGLLAFALGAALGNVVRGVSLGADGQFFAPLWTSVWWPAPGAPGQVGVVDAYTALCGLTAVAVLALHGALWLAHRVDGTVAQRARADASRLLVASALLVASLTAATLFVQPNLRANLTARPLGLLAPLTGMGALAVLFFALRAGRFQRAFRASALFIAALLGSAAYAIFPYVLPARVPAHGLTLYAAANEAGALTVALTWWIPGVILGGAFCAYAYRFLPPPTPDSAAGADSDDD
ncbi:MAG: cytochrome d ubiquinol oxidase subunit II [Myxococcales bacterium]|nr:cytochrome d ubiquinol oxidase subunit II [Myxococcales bacterium]MCB9628006.1 cytochrome d ubiquinol oxidase subunit II [Sandaracinaceae bacterium]